MGQSKGRSRLCIRHHRIERGRTDCAPYRLYYYAYRIVDVQPSKPYGAPRGPASTLPTDYKFTGQRSEEAGLGSLYDYGARHYSPALGRFLSPDSIVPSPGNPQSLNRYAYGLNNPLRYTDPTGHFSEEQLGTWFGDNWRDLFDDTWEAILWLAEFGDAVVYGGTTAVFAEQNDMLVGWNVGTRNTQAVTSIVSSHANASINLYRPWGANPNRGPSDGNILALGEMTAPEMAASYGTNVLRWIYGDDKSRTPLSLPLDWYRGPYMHMEVSTQFAGWDLGLSDMMDLTATGVATVGARLGGKKLGSAVLAGLGGLTGILALAVEVGDWTTWDTGYTIMSGAGKPVPVPVPTPPVRR